MPINACGVGSAHISPVYLRDGIYELRSCPEECSCCNSVHTLSLITWELIESNSESQ